MAKKSQSRRDPDVDAGATALEDAKISGYTDAKGHAMSRAIHDDSEIPVGGYTNITSGRSAAVKHKPHAKKSGRADRS